MQHKFKVTMTVMSKAMQCSDEKSNPITPRFTIQTFFFGFLSAQVKEKLDKVGRRCNKKL